MTSNDYHVRSLLCLSPPKGTWRNGDMEVDGGQIQWSTFLNVLIPLLFSFLKWHTNRCRPRKERARTGRISPLFFGGGHKEKGGNKNLGKTEKTIHVIHLSEDDSRLLFGEEDSLKNPWSKMGRKEPMTAGLVTFRISNDYARVKNEINRTRKSGRHRYLSSRQMLYYRDLRPSMTRNLTMFIIRRNDLSIILFLFIWKWRLRRISGVWQRIVLLKLIVKTFMGCSW